MASGRNTTPTDPTLNSCPQEGLRAWHLLFCLVIQSPLSYPTPHIFSQIQHLIPLSTSLLLAPTLQFHGEKRSFRREYVWVPSITYPTSCLDPPLLTLDWGRTCPLAFDPICGSHTVKGISLALLTLEEAATMFVSDSIKVWLWICSNSFFKSPHIYISHEIFLQNCLNLIKLILQL